MNDTPRTHRWPWVMGILLLAISAVGAGVALNNGETSSTAEDKGAAPHAVLAIGHIDVEKGVLNLHPTQQEIVEWVAEEGAVVQKGDPILKLRSHLALSKVNQARADLDAAEEQLKEAKRLPQSHDLKVLQQKQVIIAAEATRDATKAERKIKEELGVAKSVLEGYDAAIKKLDAIVELEKLKAKELELDDPQAKINRAQADVDAKQAQLRLVEQIRDEFTLKAPMDGAVLRVFVQKGEAVGASPKLPAIQFLPTGPRIVRAEVLQEWASRVRPGQTVVIEDDTFAGTKFEGKVTRVSDWFAHKRNIMIEPFMVNDVRTLECLIEITSKDHNLRIGQRVRVRIKT